MAGRCGVGDRHSWGGWLLLAAAAEQVAVGRPIPHILLLGTVLGAGTHPGANIGYLAPRSGRVLAALGLRERPGAVLIPRDRLTFIHGVDDDQSPSAALAGLPAAGHRVVLVPGGHRLAGDDARRVIGEELGQFARQTT